MKLNGLNKKQITLLVKVVMNHYSYLVSIDANEQQIKETFDLIRILSGMRHDTKQ